MVVFGGDGQRTRVGARGGAGTRDSASCSVNEHFSQLMLSLYPAELATRPLPFGSIDAIWLALYTLANNKTPAIKGKKICSLSAAVSGKRVSTPTEPACRPRPRAGVSATADFCLGDGFATQTGCHESFLRSLGLIHVVRTLAACIL